MRVGGFFVAEIKKSVYFLDRLQFLFVLLRFRAVFELVCYRPQCHVIPLGTRVYIPGYGYAVVEDTGGAIIGHRIDVAFDSVDECFEFGRQIIDIYIVD